MKKVTCINDKNLPEGANVVNGVEYEIVSEFVNVYEEKGYIIANVANRGVTKWGVKWYGYKANRFADLEEIALELHEVMEIEQGS